MWLAYHDAHMLSSILHQVLFYYCPNCLVKAIAIVGREAGWYVGVLLTLLILLGYTLFNNRSGKLHGDDHVPAGSFVNADG